jgi:hypothetical protein
MNNNVMDFSTLQDLNKKIKDLQSLGFNYLNLRNQLRSAPIENILAFAKGILSNDRTSKTLFQQLYKSLNHGTSYAPADYACYMACIKILSHFPCLNEIQQISTPLSLDFKKT